MSLVSPHETIRGPEETIFPNPRRRPETISGYHSHNEIAFQGEIVMRTIAFILTFTFVLGGGSFVTSTNTAPNAGLFMFDAPPGPASGPVVIASR
jgi:hypothetical protein